MQNNELKAGTKAEQRTAANNSTSASLEQNGMLAAVRQKRRTQKKFFLRNDKCCYCGRNLNNMQRTREHILPKSKGGTDSLKNLRPCCFECNQLKSDLELRQFKTVVWNIIKILDGRYSLKLEDLKKVYEKLRDV